MCWNTTGGMFLRENPGRKEGGGEGGSMWSTRGDELRSGSTITSLQSDSHAKSGREGKRKAEDTPVLLIAL